MEWEEEVKTLVSNTFRGYVGLSSVERTEEFEGSGGLHRVPRTDKDLGDGTSDPREVGSVCDVLNRTWSQWVVSPTRVRDSLTTTQRPPPPPSFCDYTRLDDPLT